MNSETTNRPLEQLIEDAGFFSYSCGFGIAVYKPTGRVANSLGELVGKYESREVAARALGLLGRGQ
jgi:hypothetical protein